MEETNTKDLEMSLQKRSRLENLENDINNKNRMNFPERKEVYDSC